MRSMDFWPAIASRGVRGQRGIKPATINRDLRVLRALLRRAVSGFRFPEGAFYLEDETRVRFPSPTDDPRLFAALEPPFRQIARLAALTLMRLSEIRLLRRDDVHLDQGVVLLPRAKTGPRPVILNQEAQAILREHLATHGSAWVFPNPDDRPWSRIHVSSAFRDASRAVGLRDFRFHDLRHHGATMALNAGFTAPIVMALGGWKSERMMRRYAAVTDETLRRAAEAVAGNGHGIVRTGSARVNGRD
jgi:integrase